MEVDAAFRLDDFLLFLLDGGEGYPVGPCILRRLPDEIKSEIVLVTGR